ncbi:hypothetical protein J437_LFUL011072 [Ladona fulva]|uniref:Uncharacterized protein n=1 Tax=Ladona fulva TaxID=123851 RepID=A0A8K0P2L1_LADFU|nr:hypothetical protein J437_LFUL011072 [Ladona fulva]
MTRCDEYVEDAVVDGMKAYHFRFKEGALNYSREENQCYCKERCLPSGLIDAESCYYGFPIALSYPHFYEGDPKLTEAVDGIKAIPEEHSSYFYMQVDVGLPLRMAARSQINMALRGMPGISRVEKFRNMVIPLLWTELSMEGLPPSLLMHFHILLNILPVVQTVGIIVLFISGVITIGSALFRRRPVSVISVEDEKDDQEEEVVKKTVEEEEEEKYHSLLMGDAKKGSIHWPRRISIGPSA